MGAHWEMTPHLSSDQRLNVLTLLDRREVELGRESLDESRRRTVVHGWPGEHWLRLDNGQLTDYALASRSDVVNIEKAGGTVDHTLLDSVWGESRVVEWWTRDDHGTRCGGEIVRSLHLMKVNLPVPVVPVPDGISIRTFDPERDAEAWLEQNNLAFADHPEQGAWRRADLEIRVREPWFDPSGFLLFEEAGNIVASCWTKVHELSPDRFGEIYVISVHPSHQGRGLGRVAVTQGLHVLRQKGVTRGALFVDASNTNAVSLYERLGFVATRRDHLVRFTREA